MSTSSEIKAFWDTYKMEAWKSAFAFVGSWLDFQASMVWFIGLNIVIAKFKDKFNAKVLRIINMVCGAVIILYGAKLFYNFVTLLIH